MTSAKPFSVAVLFAVLVLYKLTGSPALGQDSIPDTLAGKTFAKLLESTNSSDEAERNAFLKSAFEKSDEDTVEQRKMRTDQLRSEFGKLTFEKVIASSEYRISVSCKTEHGPRVALTVSLSENAPHKIQSMALEMGGDHGAEADDSPLDAETRIEIVNRLAEELRSKYVFPVVGNKMATAVEESLQNGDFDQFESVTEFASHLSEQLSEICHDKHLRIRAGSLRDPSASHGRRPVDNHGFVKAEMLPGGIGYLKFNFFSGEKAAQETAAAAMNFLGNSKALIFDLRENGGGSPEMIAFLSSYLFEDRVHLNSFYNRPTDTTTETWTQKDVPGKKFSPSTPVFVLTSSNTFSGAEEFTYNLKNLKRGTIVGETTGGGAHPVMPVTLGKTMYITMPFARAINPITKTNWEGVGVKPDVAVSAKLALDKAVELAKSGMAGLTSTPSSKMEKTETADIDRQDLMETANELMSDESFEEAIPLLAKLTKLDPDNGEAWFKYGYCLHLSGKLDEALVAHSKAAGFKQFAGIATYNLACAYSLKNETDEALNQLEKAIHLGFDDLNQIEGDSDLDNIRKDQRYIDLIQSLEDNR